jgi:hypothetical protein
MKRRPFTVCLVFLVALASFASACGGGGTSTAPGAVTPGNVRAVMAGVGAGRPTGAPQPPLAPGQDDCAKIVLSGQSNSAISLVKGKLSSPTVTSNWTVSSCGAQPEDLSLQYTVTSSDGFTAACGNVLTPVTFGAITISGNGGKGISLTLNVPVCPGSHVFTVTVQAVQPNGTNAGAVLATATTAFSETDLAGRGGVQNGVLHMTGTFVPDPASSPLATAVIPNITTTAVPVTYSFSGFSGQLDWYFMVPYSTGFIGAFRNGVFFGTGTGVNDTWIENIVVGYLNPCDPAQGPALCGSDDEGTTTTIELLDGDRIDWYPIAVDPSNPIMRPLMPAQIVGPRIGSAVMEPVPN